MNGAKVFARFNQHIHGLQTRLKIVAQAARFVKNNVAELRALPADLQQLVNLLLVFSKRKTHVGIVDGKHAFRPHRILVERHRNRAQRLRGQHGGIQAWAVAAHHHHVLATAQPGLVQAAGNVLDELTKS